MVLYRDKEKWTDIFSIKQQQQEHTQVTIVQNDSEKVLVAYLKITIPQ